MEIQTVKASEFKAKCLSMMDEVAASGRELVITKNGKPVAKLSPLTKRKKKKPKLFGMWKDKIKITGDIMSPIEANWGEDEDHLYE